MQNDEIEKYWITRYNENKEETVKQLSEVMKSLSWNDQSLEDENIDLANNILPKFMENDEARAILENICIQETIKSNKESYKKFVQDLLTLEDSRLDEMCWIKTLSKDMPYEKLPTVDEPMSIREAMLDRITEQPYYLYLHRYNETNYSILSYSNRIIPKSECNDEEIVRMHEEYENRKAKKEENSDENSEEGQINVYYGYNMKYYSNYNINNIGEWLYSSGSMTNGDRAKMGNGEKIAISVNKSQLLKNGLNPEKLGWKSLKQIEEENNNTEEEKIIDEVDSVEIEVVKDNAIKRLFNTIKMFFKNIGKKKETEE